jgi:hypothetical protein
MAMKDFTSYPAGWGAARQTVSAGAARRQNKGDFASFRPEAVPEPTRPPASRIGTPGGNGIRLAVAGNRLALQQEENVEGAGRSPLPNPRNTNTSPVGGSGPSPAGPNPDPSPAPSPVPGPNPAPSPQFNALQQSWLDANAGPFANLLRHNLGRSEPFEIHSVSLDWLNGGTGKPEFMQRAVGNVSPASGQELAQLLGGTLVQSPFGTFGTGQRDQYIRMPTGQMIEASVLANQLNAARQAKDPFSATQGVLEIYQREAQAFDLASSTNAIDLVTKGILRPTWPQEVS